jgi:hypothetical protein
LTSHPRRPRVIIARAAHRNARGFRRTHFYLLFLVLDVGLLIAAVIIAIMIRKRDRTARELAAVERDRGLLERER